MTTKALDSRWHTIEGSWELLEEIWSKTAKSDAPKKIINKYLKRQYEKKTNNIPFFPKETGRIIMEYHDKTPLDRSWLSDKINQIMIGINMYPPNRQKVIKLINTFSDEEIATWTKDNKKLGVYIHNISHTLNNILLSYINLKRKPHYFVMSINPLDIALMSEYSSYRTCYSFDGEYNYGPQIHIMDKNTIICYIYSSLVTENNVTLPKKKMRQAAYYDKRGPMIAFSTIYGSDIRTPLFVEKAKELLENTHKMSFKLSLMTSRERYPDEYGDGNCPFVYLDELQCRLVPEDVNHIYLTLDLPDTAYCLNCGSEMTTKYDYTDICTVWACDDCDGKCQQHLNKESEGSQHDKDCVHTRVS